jgi:hypothetical protein
MNKLIATLLLLTSVNAFTVPSSRSSLNRVQIPNTNADNLNSFPATSTSLQLKIKVDPDAKGNKNVDGNVRMAAYGGSVLVALALPFIFLIWSAVNK